MGLALFAREGGLSSALPALSRPFRSPDSKVIARRGVVILDGRAVDSRRYAIDWKQIRDGASFSGDARDVRSYYSYGKAVLAVADGRVITARDGLPNNIPGHGESFHPAVPISLDTVAGSISKSRLRQSWRLARACSISHNHARPGWRSVCLLHASATGKVAR